MEIKICTNCGETKPLDCYNYKDKPRNIRNSHCQTCTRKASAKAYRKRRKYYIAANYALKQKRLVILRAYICKYLQKHGCVDCGIKDPVVLQFDHVRGKKLGDLSSLVSTAYGLATIDKEISKCEVRCANCHTRKTAKERGYYDKISFID